VGENPVISHEWGKNVIVTTTNVDICDPDIHTNNWSNHTSFKVVFMFFGSIVSTIVCLYCFLLCFFTFDHCIVRSSYNDGFWLAHCYLQGFPTVFEEVIVVVGFIKTKDRATRTPLKTRDELWSSWRVSSSCTTSGTGRVNLVTNLVICHEWGMDQKVFTTSGTYSFLSYIA
jgi:hypothetical protein